MNWIFFTWLLFFSSCGYGVRRKSPRPCRATANPCAQRCLLYYPKRIRCLCYKGFAVSKRNPKDCVDINECDTNNGGCAHTCTNIPGGRLCSCRRGFNLASNLRSCLPQDPSTECAGVTHHCEHFCNGTSSGHLCSCRQGFRLHSNGRSCIRKCLFGNGGCNHICNRKGDQMYCTCKPNHRLAEDGRTCIALHTCAVDNGGCNAECEDTPIGVQCSCRIGYLLKNDQRSCEDIDECATNNGGCQHGCRNSQGSFICTCPIGYKLAPNERDCVDIDECLLNDTCWSGCVNSPGSYQCTCERGFQKFAVKRCGDINECTVNNGGCAHVCTNTHGGYKCSCNAGHKLLWNQKDCVRESKCYSLKQPRKPAALVKVINREMLLDCLTSGKFFSFYSPRPSYKYVCGMGEGILSTNKREKRISTTLARPLWWSHNLEINDTLPDCTDPNWVTYGGRFAIKADHCHLLRVRPRPALASRPPRALIKYFSITCEKKQRGKARITVVLAFNIRVPTRGCKKSKRRRGRIICAGKKAMNMIKRSMKRQQFRIRFGTSNLLVRKRSTVKRGGKPIPGIHSTFGCFLGSVQNQGKCSPCGSGSFFNLSTSLCQPCSPGTYQDKKGQLSCNKCPFKGTSNVTSATDVTQCPGVCPVGHFSRDGFVPCQPCPLGFYQPNPGRIACFKCGHGLTTRSSGSDSFSSCLVRALCSAGHFYNIRTSSCRRCPVGFYQPDSGKNFCFSCPGNTTTDYDASDSVESCKDTRCGGVIGDLQGVIESPNYPGDYPINTRCTWVIKPPKNRKLLLVIPEIFLPGGDCEDSLIMKSKRGSTSGRVTYQSCQSFLNPLVVTARSKRLFIEFKSNEHGGAKGFQIPYVTYDENYDKIILDITRDYRLFSPNFHQNILKDKRSRQTLFNVLAKPEMYFSISPQITNELFPSSFVAFLEQKVTKFFSH